jgi:hypothetical protein
MRGLRMIIHPVDLVMIALRTIENSAFRLGYSIAEALKHTHAICKEGPGARQYRGYNGL